MATIGSATLTAPLICSHEVATPASVALPVYDDEVGLGGLLDREPDDRPERELCPGFKFVSARSMHIVDVHTDLIISSGPNEAKPENRPGDAFGGEDSDRSPGINFDTPKEILAHQKASHPWPEPPAEELSPSRAGGHGASQSEWEPQFPQVPASGVEQGSGSTFCLPRVQMDTPSSPKREIEAIYVNEESPFLQECELPDGPGSARDPLSFEDEMEAKGSNLGTSTRRDGERSSPPAVETCLFFGAAAWQCSEVEEKRVAGRSGSD
ncbi:uncharacterized protein LOC124553841 isoform X2 [Schistocerca americana]|uniref:uncharacterized protein LOC124553841 isoform X2 n=1 Tax=Schistocerca americana TaxID=7009 RepID=UPI001F4FEBB9|nr:uncharacterized protein LOC124553841 isoform X2 [Schistocerca americana]